MQVQIPYLRATSTSKQLVVNGEPFLMCAGELQNSSFTSSKYMAEAWPKLAEANLNTVLGSVTWEQIEPEEDKFDFSELDECLRVVRGSMGSSLCCFGLEALRMVRSRCCRVARYLGTDAIAGLSTYAPAWVKTNTKRFPRARLRKAGGELAIGDVLSIFHSEAQKADAKAFSKLMAHLKEVDEKHSTVIMVQVENETGLLDDSRDGSAAAEKRFNSAVPSELVKALTTDKDILRPELRRTIERVSKNSTGTWPEVFGKSPRTDELFMAYHYALYLEQVAFAGKQAYPLPLYTNVWQNYNDMDADNDFPIVVGGGSDPGDYPSGGGFINVLDIWQTFAPSLNMVCPDVYLNDYSTTCAK
jgi:beta-galactosidase GanA